MGMGIEHKEARIAALGLLVGVVFGIGGSSMSIRRVSRSSTPSAAWAGSSVRRSWRRLS